MKHTLGIFRVFPAVLSRHWAQLVLARKYAILAAAFVGCLPLLAMAASAVDALEYRPPHDPIRPTSQEECNALYDRYQAIINQTRAEEKAERDTWWSLFKQWQAGKTSLLEFLSVQTHTKAVKVSSENTLVTSCAKESKPETDA